MAVITIDFGKPKIVVFIGSTSFDHVTDVIADDALFCGSRLTLLKKCIGIVGDSFFTVFRCSRIEWCIEMCAVLQENHLKC